MKAEIVKQFPQTTQYTELRGMCAIFDEGVLVSNIVRCVVVLSPGPLELNVFAYATERMTTTCYCREPEVRVHINGELVMRCAARCALNEEDSITLDDPRAKR